MLLAPLAVVMATSGNAEQLQNVAVDAVAATMSASDKLKEICQRVEQMQESEIEVALRGLQFPKGISLDKDIDATDTATATPIRAKVESGSIGEELGTLVKDNKVFDAEGRLGMLFSKLHGKGTDAHELYNADRTYAAKDDYKREWQELLLEQITVGKEHIRSHAHVDRKKGVYLNFGLYVESYGVRYNRELAIKRAVSAVSKCTMTSGGWINHDRLGDCTGYLKLHRDFEDEFKEAWSH